MTALSFVALRLVLHAHFLFLSLLPIQRDLYLYHSGGALSCVSPYRPCLVLPCPQPCSLFSVFALIYHYCLFVVDSFYCFSVGTFRLVLCHVNPLVFVAFHSVVALSLVQNSLFIASRYCLFKRFFPTSFFSFSLVSSLKFCYPLSYTALSSLALSLFLFIVFALYHYCLFCVNFCLFCFSFRLALCHLYLLIIVAFSSVALSLVQDSLFIVSQHCLFNDIFCISCLLFSIVN